MNYECWISNCGHTHQDNDCIFILFPRDSSTLRLWQSHLGNFGPHAEESRVCSCHFESLTSDYIYVKPESMAGGRNNDLEKICRICLGNDDLTDFPEIDHKSYLQLLGMRSDVDLPKTVCRGCLKDLQKATAFVDKCKHSLAVLNSYKSESLGLDPLDSDAIKEESDSDSDESQKQRCETCGEFFKNLAVHIRKSAKCVDPNFKREYVHCKSCKLIFEDYDALVEHEKTHQITRKRGRPRRESAEVKPSSSVRSPRPGDSQCTKCGGYFQKLWVHIANSKSCQPDEPPEYACKECGKVFLKRTSLVEHSRILHKKVRGRPKKCIVEDENAEPERRPRKNSSPKKRGRRKKIKKEESTSDSEQMSDLCYSSDEVENWRLEPNKEEEIEEEKLVLPDEKDTNDSNNCSTIEKALENPKGNDEISSGDEKSDEVEPIAEVTRTKFTRNEEFLCHLCSRLFKRYSTLATHLKNHDKKDSGLLRRRGRPTAITRERLELCMKKNLTAKQMAEYFGCSIQCIYRHCIANGMRMLTSRYTPIDDEDLKREIGLIHEQFPTSGAEMMNGHLQAKGIYVQRRRVRSLLAEIDPSGTVQRRTHIVKKHENVSDKEAAISTPKIRQSYAVPAPNSLWHLDANLKLGRWGFVIHGCIDGYSRVILYLKCGTCSTASSVVPHFLKSVQLNGMPRQVQSIFGYENDLTEFLQTAIRQANGDNNLDKSLQVQRIKKLWIDIYKQTIDVFEKEFFSLEESGDLDPHNKIHRYALQRIYLERINRKLDLFSNGWNSHKVSKAGAKTPFQCYQENLIGNDDVDVSTRLAGILADKQLDFDVLILPDNVAKSMQQLGLELEQEVHVERILHSDSVAKLKFVELVQYLSELK